ncbi:MFS transporter [Vibrio rotiferianus]|nr:MFS transporter [Vibrio rotiferianus]
MTRENKVVWIAALIQFVNIVDFMMVMPLGPDMAKSLPISNTDIGVICGCYTLAVGFSGILCSKFLDNFDRKKVAVITVLGLSLGTVSAAFAGDLNTLIAARVLAGIFGGPAAAIALSMIADIVPPERRGKAMAIVMGTFSVSSVVAIPFGLELARLGSWKTPFYGIFFLGCFALLLIFLWTPAMKEHLNSKNKPISVIKLIYKPKYVYAYVMMLTAMIATYAIIPPLSAYLQLNMGYPRESLGFLYLSGGIVTLVLTQVAGRLSDRIGSIPTNIIGTALSIVFLYDGFMHQPISSVPVIFCMFMGTVLIRNVSAMTEASKLSIPQERAGFMSLLSSVQHIGNGIGAFIASLILTTGVNGQLVHMEWVAAISIVFALIQPVCLVVIKKKSVAESMLKLDELKVR